MKTLNSILKERELLFEQALNNDFENKREVAKAQKRVLFLNLCVNYLKSEPDKAFIEKEIKRIEARIKVINDLYYDWLPIESYENDKARFAAYLRLHGIKELKEQLKTLIYLNN